MAITKWSKDWHGLLYRVAAGREWRRLIRSSRPRTNRLIEGAINVLSWSYRDVAGGGTKLWVVTSAKFPAKLLRIDPFCPSSRGLRGVRFKSVQFPATERAVSFGWRCSTSSTWVRRDRI